jgi:hypothetical protein
MSVLHLILLTVAILPGCIFAVFIKNLNFKLVNMIWKNCDFRLWYTTGSVCHSLGHDIT